MNVIDRPQYHGDLKEIFGAIKNQIFREGYQSNQKSIRNFVIFNNSQKIAKKFYEHGYECGTLLKRKV